MDELPPNDDMIDGYMDGRDLDNPEPCGNRSHSYRHGFLVGRNDSLPDGERPFRGMTLEAIAKLSYEAMKRDKTRH